MNCGLLGQRLGHSYSPTIHAQLAAYEYTLYEREPEELEEFVSSGDWSGLNVTIPYKKSVVPYCRELSETARKLGSVNTLVRMPGGGIYGDNTDYYGFQQLVEKSGIDVCGKKALVLGSGGASVTVCAVLEELSAEVIVISRGSENNYDNLDRNADAEIIVNTTPLGMYPKNGAAAVDLRRFPDCRAVFDLVYNPARTALILQAESLGIPCESGLYMLVAQAKRSAEQFANKSIDDTEIARIEKALSSAMKNIILIGMPGCGKSTVAKRLSERLGRQCFETDSLIEAEAGSIPEIFAGRGEEYFRELETAAIQKLGKMSGTIISTGGGCVTRTENYAPLHQNGTIICLKRDISKLARDGRPISLSTDLNTLYERRRPAYERFADFEVSNEGSIEETVERILEVL